MKTVAKKLKNKETKSSLLVDKPKISKTIIDDKPPKRSKTIIDDKPKKVDYKKRKHGKQLSEPLSSLLMSNFNIEKNDNISNDITPEIHKPEIFIDTKYNELSIKLKSDKTESISHKNPSLQEFLNGVINDWSDEQILSYFTHYLSDPRLNELNKLIIDDILIPKEIWQIIVQFEFGCAENQIKRRYYHWISQQRKEIYWIPFILGSIQCFGVFFVLFYVFVSGTSLHDATDIGAADITKNNKNKSNKSNDSIFDIRFYAALITVIAAVLQIFGALKSYYLARFTYSKKLKRFKRIIHLVNKNENKNKNNELLNSDIDNNNNNNNNNNDNDNNTDPKYEKVRDLPNVEINFDINQVPQKFRHIFLMKKDGNKYNDVDSDSDEEKKNDDIISDDDDDSDDNNIDDDDDIFYDNNNNKKRLNYMMGIIDDGDDICIDNNKYNLEEMQLILCGWESYISFQRWINLSSLVVTDNLHDPYLICFVLHKYFYVLCISTYVFGQNLTIWESLIPFIILFLSFSYLGLIVLDRISAKRAILYVLSMVGCCGIIIGIFTGILFLLSYLFYEDSTNNIPPQTLPPNTYDNNNNTSLQMSTTFIPFNITLFNNTINNSTNVTSSIYNTIQNNETHHSQQQSWWITDFFYPILAFILCSNTIRRIRNGFENNIPEIKYTLWSNCCFVSLIMTFATNSATWSNAEVKAAFLLVFVYMGYLWAQMRLHQAVTRLKKIDYANKYLQNSGWVKKQLFWSWLGIPILKCLK